MCTGVAAPAGWVTSDSPNPPPVSSPDASRSNSDPSAHVPGPSPAPRTRTEPFDAVSPSAAAPSLASPLPAEPLPSPSPSALAVSVLPLIAHPSRKLIRTIIGSIQSNLGDMTESVKPRTYRSSVREEQARRTRLAILDAARLLFTEQGYAATTIAQIAARARVAVDTVYAAVGTKPVLMRLLVEVAISGADQPVPAEERDYVRQIRAAETAGQKIRIYAEAVTEVDSRLA